MSLSHVLLTSLIERPSSGFELARRFDKSMGFFWKATHQQIYRELGTMQSKGWISILENQQDTGRKKTYQVELAGRIELTEWLNKQGQPAQLREELMVRLRVEAQLGQNTLLPELERHLMLHQNQLKLYQIIFDKDFAQSNDQDRKLYIHKMILQLGIELEQGWINWLERVIYQLKQFDQASE